MDEELFTLEILHLADQEAGIPAVEDAVNLSAVIETLDNDEQFENTLRLTSGDVYIPGPFFAASADLYMVPSDEGPEPAGIPGIGDILINNALGFQAATFGNHEFDQGTGVIADLLTANPDLMGPGIEDGGYPGTLFPYLSSNLDFSTDEALAPLVVPAGEAPQPNTITDSVVIEVGGDRIGVVGATTPTLESISSPGDVGVLPASDSNEELAAIIQEEVDALTAEGINKIVLQAHFQQIGIEQEVAQLLEDVDVVIAGGSNTILANEDDRLRPDDEGEAAGPYPVELQTASGEPVVLVNTDGNYRYVGRLALNFDENGLINEVLEESGAFATDDEGVAALIGEGVEVSTVADPVVVEVTDAIGAFINENDGNIFGETEVFLNGTRSDVRTQETNLGNLTADANLFYANALTEGEVAVSIKNGGGIRDNIGVSFVPPGSTTGELVQGPPQANPEAGKEEGEISELDIANSLRFNNDLSLLTVTAQELEQIVEHGVAGTAPGATPGQFPQIGGLAFSFDLDLQPIVFERNDEGVATGLTTDGERVQSLALTDEEGNVTDVIVQDGELVGDSDREIRLVTLSFLADGGDSYPFPLFSEERVDLAEQDLPEGEATFAPVGTEQDALAEYLAATFPADEDPNTPVFNTEEVGPAEDTRIQNLNEREDTVIPDSRSTGNNVIFIHPDGTSPAHYAAARYVSQGPDGRLNWDMMTDAGVYLGHLDNQLVSTSNAGAVVHAYGIKPYDGTYGLDENGNEYASLSAEQGVVAEPGLTIMEEAIQQGTATAVINSGFIAEPGTGVFLATAEDRDQREEITAQVVESGVNVILGAGEVDYLPEGEIGFFGVAGTREDGRNLIEEAEAMGYTVIYTPEQLQNLDPSTERVLGIFGAEDTYNDTTEGQLREDGLVDENGNLIFYGQPEQNNPNPPTVADMLDATLNLELFQNNEEGFFIVLEEEGSDNFGNNNNGPGTIEATLRADEAIGVAMDYVDSVDPNTLIITAADSDAGGLQVDDVEGDTVGTVPVQPVLAEDDDSTPDVDETGAVQVPYDGQEGNNTEPFVTGTPARDGDTFEFGVGWSTLNDVEGSIVSKTYGLNAEQLPSTVDNTGIYRLMYQTLFDVELESTEGVPDDFDTPPAPEATEQTGGVIFIHPDGTSPAHYATARYTTGGPDSRLNWDRMSNAGVYLGHLDNTLVSTSNGGAVVHAYGIKSYDGSYGFDENGDPYTSLSGEGGTTIMEEAIAEGKPTAVINSGLIAEPGTGVFLASVENRSETEEITAQIVESGVNVILGAGETDYLPVGTVGRFGEEGTREDGRNLIEEAEAMGYTVIYTPEQLQNLDPSTERVLGIFGAEDTYNDTTEGQLREDGLVDEDGNLIFYGQPPENPNPPTVAQMLEVTLNLDLFQEAEDGFMVVLEEEGTDNFGNNDNGPGTVKAMERADEAIGVALDFVDNVNPNTLVLTAADSDAGGLQIEDVDADAETVGTTDVQAVTDRETAIEVPLDGQAGNNTEPFVTGGPDADGDTFNFGVNWVGTPDFEGSIVSKAYGLNAEDLPATADNTDMYRLMYQSLFGAQAEQVSQQNVVAGSTEDDVFDAADPSDGFDGIAELVFAGAGNDLVDTSQSVFGQNRISAGDGADEILVGNNERVFGGEGDDIIDASLGEGGNRLYGGEGNDNILVGSNDRAFGQAGNDTIDASQGEGGNRLYGDEGNDTFLLGVNDVILGGEGEDRMFVITGGGNTMTGGADADEFWIAIGEIPTETNTVTDFELGTDVIGIGGIEATFGENLIATQDESNTLVALNGTNVAVLLGIQANSLSAESFVIA